MYKQGIDRIKLFIEEGTENVPNDGRFYVLKDDQIVNSYRTLREAQMRYKELLKASNYKPRSKKSKPDLHKEDIENFLRESWLRRIDRYKPRKSGRYR